MTASFSCRLLAIAFLWFVSASHLLGQSATGTLHVKIVDASGKSMPAMACITSAADGTWRVPPDGTIVSPPPVTGNEQIAGWAAGPDKWSSGEPGPVRLIRNSPISGISTDQRAGGSYATYAGSPALPYWNEPVAYFMDKPFTITLPPGKWRLSVEHGAEYLPVIEEVTIAAGQEMHRKVKLTRWIDMPKQGWYSGDPEFHDWRDQPWRNDFILTWARAQDIHMTSVLSYSAPTKNGHPQMGYGKDFRYQLGAYALASGHEGPRTNVGEQGHLMQLNITSIASDSRTHLMGRACDEVHSQSGLCGYAHLAWSAARFNDKNPEMHAGWDASINTIREKIDFMEILQFRQLGTEDYYDFLNMGIKLTALSASDVTGGDTLGESPTFAYTGPHFSPDAWYRAIKQGHTFVTNGPMLKLTVDGYIPGDVINVRKNAKVRVVVHVFAPDAIGAPKILEIVSHGHVIKTVESHDPHKAELTAGFIMPIAESQWIVARTISYNGAAAHTSPVYVVVNGASFADRAQLPQLIAKRLEILSFIEQRLRDSDYVARNNYTSEDVSVLLADIDDARTKYKAALAAGGISPTAPRQ